MIPQVMKPIIVANSPNLDVIEEKADECGTGMENIKVLLRDPQRK